VSMAEQKVQECGGSGICEHGRQRMPRCGGVCEQSRQKSLQGLLENSSM
jgi:hypothetical protein